MDWALRRIFCAALCGFSGWSSAGADTVKLFGKPEFRDVQILGFEDGRLAFRGLSRQVLRKPLSQVEWLAIDAYPAVAQAENPPDGDAVTAVAAYEQAIAAADEPWLERLLRVRQVQALDRAGRFDEAVALYLRLLGDRIAGVDAVRPRRPGSPGDPANQRARELIETALDYGRYRAHASDLQRLRLEILLWDGVDPLPAPFAAQTGEPGGRLAGRGGGAWGPDAAGADGIATGETAGAIGRNPPDGNEPAAEPLPPRMFGDIAPETDNRTRLGADSFVLSGARDMIAAGRIEPARRLLERARVFAAHEARLAWKLPLERCRIECGDAAGAAERLARMADSPEATSAERAEALYYVGLAHERQHRSQAAAGAWRRLLELDGVPDGIRREAGERLREIGREQRWIGRE